MPESYRFDRFELRPAERVLLVDGVPAALGSRAFDLLLCLVTQRDRVLSKGEVLDQVWPGQVVEENNLSVHVSALRKVLGAGAITTVSGRGYRFTLDLQPGSPVDPAPLATESLDRPTIAVMPLSVLSDDPRIGFFAQGLVEDVTALLARVPGFPRWPEWTRADRNAGQAGRTSFPPGIRACRRKWICRPARDIWSKW